MDRQSLDQLIDQAVEEHWEELDLSGWELTALPPEIGKLTQLKRLVLGKWDQEKQQWLGIGLIVLPEALSQLVNLTELILSGNPLTQIADCVNKLEALESLHLAQTQLAAVEPSITSLTNLRKLYLWGNQLRAIPESLAQLTNLTQLDLHQNQISVIPKSLGQLSNLSELDLSQNQISVIPKSLCQLTNLSELYLHRNQISVIPESLGQLSNLSVLALSYNQISVIPKSLGQLSNLSVLYLNNNQISEIPESLAQLTTLTQLYLSTNQISALPESLAQLSNLSKLILNKNQISALPESLAQLTNLSVFYLWGNQISEIPESLFQLTNLSELALSQNQISALPESLAQLTNLRKLYLNQNQISALPESLAQLSNLTRLELDENRISVIPAWIAQLSKLTVLGLAQNAIRELPPALAKLDQLTVLRLEKNPLSIPPETLRQGWGEQYQDPGKPQSILNYYFTTRDPNQTQTLYEVKLLLVGEGGAGKTSLANKLLDPDYPLKAEAEDTSTKGIDILKWEFTGRDGNAYRINLWDFGGQEIYHQTHQFFLTERSLYLLVADSRKEDTDHYFWLKSIQLFSQNSPVLLIQNEKQNRTCNLNFNQLRGEFANLRDTYRVNLLDNRGLAALQRAIQRELEALIPHGIPFPNKWLAVRYALANDGRNYIDCADYEATCRGYGITTREEMFQLSQFLHDLGICLHFQKDPILCNRLILKPNWGTAAVYKILDNDTVKQHLGQFSDADLVAIWAAPEYADMRHALLQLMKEFKVCYEIPRRKGQYIAPNLLSADAPNFDWQSEPNLILRYHYKGGFMPKGILTRFIVEMHQSIENVSDPEQALVWKTGVILTNGAARAQVLESYAQRRISIRVSGNRPRDLLTVIHNEFQKIHDSFDERLECDTLIPCNCGVCKLSPDPYDFPLERLYQRIDRGIPTIECHESGEQVNVRALIDGVIIDHADDPERFEESGRDRFIGEPRRDRLGKLRRDQLRPQPPSVNVSFTVPINNTNQQEHSMNDITNNLQGANVGSFANEVKDQARQQSIQHIHQTNNQNLAQAAQDIKALLDQLAVDYPAEDDFTRAGRAVGAIKNNPTLKQRVTNALKESGTTAVEKAIEAVTDNPAVSIIVAGVKGFVEAEGKAH